MKKQSAFTLIEMLVTIAIMALLAGLLFPGINQAMRAARQTRDTANAKSIGQILIAEAMDNDGFFRTNSDLSDATTGGTTKSVFQGLVDDGKVDDPRIFAAEGSRQAKSLTLNDDNIGFQYVAGLSTGSPTSTPLVFTKGAGVTIANLNNDKIPVGDSSWKRDGIVVAFTGGHARFLKNTGRNEAEIKLDAPLMLNPVPDGIAIYE